MSEMLEKVADAIWELGAADDIGKSDAANYATAVVEAMRDASSEMCIAGHIALEAHLGVVHHRSTLIPAVWRAMIDSILSTPTTKGEVK